MRRLLPIALGLFLWAAPAHAFVKTTGFQTMTDGTSLAYDLYEPDGAPPSGGFPGIMLLHGLGGSKDDMAPIAAVFVSHGYAVLAYTARGEGTSTGDLTLAGPNEISDERALEQWFAALPEVSDTQIGAWGVSYGGGETWDGIGAGIPFKAAEVVETWTDLYSALWPGNVAKSGIVAGFAKSVDARSPLVTSIENDAVRSTNLGPIKALADARSVAPELPSITTPIYMFQGRVDYAFDVSQALNGFTHLGGPKKLYVGQFGHTPSTFPGPDFAYVMTQGVAWFDHYLLGAPNGIDKAPPVTIAAASGAKRTSYAGVPKTKTITVGFPGTAVRRTGPVFRQGLETFGVSLLKVQVARVVQYPRLVVTVLAGKRVITHGAIVPKKGLLTIRLANYVQYLPKGTRLSITLGASSAQGDLAYLGFGDENSITLGSAELELQVLTKPVTQ